MALPHLGSRLYAILLALSEGERHGYDLMRQIALDSGNRLTMGPATLYTSIKRLVQLNLIEETEERSEAPHAASRRYYRLSSAGEKALQEELERVRRFVKIGQQRLV